MSTTYLLDTNTLSYIAKGKSAEARARLQAVPHKDAVCISAITEAELRYGLARRPAAHALHVAMEALLFKVRILSWGSKEAAVYGQLRFSLESAGVGVSALDLLIAAQAIAADAVLVTHDKVYSHIPNLRAIEN